MANRARKNRDGMRMYCLKETRLCFGDCVLRGRVKFDVSGRGTETCSTEDWLMIWESTTCVGLFEG